MALFSGEKVKTANCADEYDFENRFKFPVKINVSANVLKDARLHYEALIERNIKLLRKVPNRAKAMEAFDYVMIGMQARVDELKRLKEQGKKIIGTFCVQVPEELIYAADCIPIRLSCGFLDAISVGEEILPKNICPMVRASIGFPFLKINPYFELCDVIAIPTTCDAKKKMADVLSNFKDVWVLELPNNRVQLDAMDKWQSQARFFKMKLERFTGRRITKKKLKETIQLLYKRTQLSRRLMEIRKHKNYVINGRDAQLVMQSAFYDDIHRWLAKLNSLCDELEQNLIKGKFIAEPGTARIMLSGSPTIWPNFKVLNIIEQQNAIVAIDDSCAGTQYFYNPPEVTDWAMKSMLNAIANKYLLPTICPVFLHNDDRVERVTELVEQFSVEGLVYHVLRLCQVMDFDYAKVNNVMKSKSFPVLKVETEYGEEDSGQLRTRVEAFIEMIRSRRK